MSEIKASVILGEKTRAKHIEDFVSPVLLKSVVPNVNFFIIKINEDTTVEISEKGLVKVKSPECYSNLYEEVHGTVQLEF